MSDACTPVGPIRLAEARTYQDSYLSVVPDAPLPSAAPDRRDPADSIRIRAACAAVHRHYTGAVRAVLLDALNFHAAGGHRINPSSLPARLVDELLRPPDTA